MVLKLSERKWPLDDYGMAVKIQLLKMNKTQNWLIEEIKKKLPNQYIDSSNLNRIMTGALKCPNIRKAINEILSIETVNR